MNETVKNIIVTTYAIQKDVNSIIPRVPSSVNTQYKVDIYKDDKIFLALKEKSEDLANMYAQVKVDIESNDRLCWVGTAHEVREVLTQLLRLLAPDEHVKKQSWYEQEPLTSGPTQRQRVIYITKNRNTSTNEKEVLKKISCIDEMVGGLVRSTYARASDAAHGSTSRQEVMKILKYFDAFAFDLLDL